MPAKRTADRGAPGKLAPGSTAHNDDVLFGRAQRRESELPLKTRRIVPVAGLMAQGPTDRYFRYPLPSAKQNGATGTEIVRPLTHDAFYAAAAKENR